MSKICRTFAAKFEKVMKKYNQPSVESANVLFGSMVMAGSPTGIEVGDPINNGTGD